MHKSWETWGGGGADCGRSDINLEEVEDPGAYRTCVLQAERLAVRQQWKDVRDRLEHWGQSYKLCLQDPTRVGAPNPSK